MLSRDFKEFAESLATHRVEALVVGGYALAAHGHPRYTGDIDFWIRPEPQNIERLLEALAAFGFASLGLTAADFEPGNVVQLGVAPNRIDLLTRIQGVEFDACWGRRERVVLDGVALDIIGVEDFKANKRAVGRQKDLADLEAIERPRDP
jgi:predicted nucleotidyltransferase